MVVGTNLQMICLVLPRPSLPHKDLCIHPLDISFTKFTLVG